MHINPIRNLYNTTVFNSFMNFFFFSNNLSGVSSVGLLDYFWIISTLLNWLFYYYHNLKLSTWFYEYSGTTTFIKLFIYHLFRDQNQNIKKMSS